MMGIFLDILEWMWEVIKIIGFVVGVVLGVFLTVVIIAAIAFAITDAINDPAENRMEIIYTGMSYTTLMDKETGVMYLDTGDSAVVMVDEAGEPIIHEGWAGENNEQNQ